MTPYEIAEQVFAVLGLICFSFQLAPQVWVNYKRKSTHGLSTLMIFLFYLATIVLGGYSFGTGMSILIKIQPEIFLIFAIAILGQIVFYRGRLSPELSSPLSEKEDVTIVSERDLNSSPEKSRLWQALGVVTILIIIAVASQYGLYILTIQAGPPPNITITILSLLTPILAFLGFMPQFVEIYKLKRVVGVSIAFLVTDAFGGIFNIISLIFLALQNSTDGSLQFDVPALAGFAVIASCDLMILLLYPILERRYKTTLGQ